MTSPVIYISLHCAAFESVSPPGSLSLALQILGVLHWTYQLRSIQMHALLHSRAKGKLRVETRL